MKVCLCVLIAVLLGLCTAASAGNIYTSGYGDAVAAYSDWSYADYNTSQFGGGSNCLLFSESATSLSLSKTYSYTSTGHGYNQSSSQGAAVMVFSIASLRGTVLPECIKLWFYGTLSDSALSQNEWAWYHKDADLGPSANTNDHPAKGSCTLVGYQNPQPGSSAWMWVDVTSQIQQDLDRHFNYSAFMLEPTVNDMSGTVGASEGGNGAYLAVPEPGSMAFLACGLCGVLGCALRRRR